MQTIATIKQAKQSHHLAPAVIRQLGNDADAVSSAIDAARYGASGGFTGFTYYSDTCAFTSRHRADIAQAVSDMADDLGEAGAIALVSGFCCLDNPPEQAVSIALYGGRAPKSLADDVMMVENALAWFALEDVGRAIESIGGAA